MQKEASTATRTFAAQPAPLLQPSSLCGNAATANQGNQISESLVEETKDVGKASGNLHVCICMYF
jgi:hypothetical protein